MNRSDLRECVDSLGEACRGLFDAQMSFCDEIIGNLKSFAPRLNVPPSQACCTIPEPCWMPRSVGEHESVVCKGGSASVEVKVVNCDRVKRTFTISAAGEGAGFVKINPTTLALGPKESGKAAVTFSAGDGIKDCDGLETLIWVLGCNEHYLRWNVRIGKQPQCGCIDVTVEDCPDYVHHWYDHFYCHRPCYGRTAAKG
jgi:hypothetical protein